jgi:hypothetical protein
MSLWLVTVRRKRLTLLGAGLALLLGLWALSSLVVPHRDLCVEAIHKRGYPATPAEVDAWYLSVPPAENAALVYTNAFGLLTNTTGPITNFTGKSWLPPIGQGLSSEEQSELKAVLAECQPALRLFYSAPASGRSRYPIHLQDWPGMLLPHLGKTKQAVSLLSAEALLHATGGDAEKATQAFLAAGRLADSLSEEPIPISQLVRYADWGILLSRLERALCLTAFTDRELASLQEAVEAAERPRAMARTWAGERAMHLSIYTDRKMMEVVFREGYKSGSRVAPFLAAACSGLFRAAGLLQKDEAFFCDRMEMYVGASELPYPARFAATQQLTTMKNPPAPLYIFSRLLLPPASVQARDADHVARVRVAVAALAIERFRLAHTNALPETLEQLAPTCCKAMPADPFDGKPLRYKTHGASYVVYSVGSDGQDEGGVVWDSNYLKVPGDVSFVVKH